MPSKGQLDSRSMPHRLTGVTVPKAPEDTSEGHTVSVLSVLPKKDDSRTGQGPPSPPVVLCRSGAGLGPPPWRLVTGALVGGRPRALRRRRGRGTAWAPECAGDSWTPLLRSSRADAGLVNHHDPHFPWAGGRVDLVHIPRLNTGPSTVRASAGRGSPRTRTAVKAGRGSNMTRHSSANQSNKPRLAHPQYNGSGLRNRKGG